MAADSTADETADSTPVGAAAAGGGEVTGRTGPVRARERPLPDPIFSDPRLARLYDAFDGERSDLAEYVRILQGLGARSVLDVGCGTGTLACTLALQGISVVGVDPAAASLAVAAPKEGANRVRWLCGYAADTALMRPRPRFDAATMTGNVAQAIVDETEWTRNLVAVREALHPGGHLVLESRRPGREAWKEWTRERTLVRREVRGGEATAWNEVTGVTGDLVSFRWTFVLPGGEELTSDTTLRFRSEEGLRSSLRDAGYDVLEVEEAPDRPGHELVVTARAAG